MKLMAKNYHHLWIFPKSIGNDRKLKFIGMIFMILEYSIKNIINIVLNL